MLARRLLLVSIIMLTLNGCAFAALGVNGLAMRAGIVSYAATGKGLADHAMGIATNQDCRIVEGMLRQARDVCVARNAEVTRDEFKGLLHTVGKPEPVILVRERIR